MHIPHTPWIIEDSPRFRHRGVLVDTSRQFLTVPELKRLVMGMHMAKLNVFHVSSKLCQLCSLVRFPFAEVSRLRLSVAVAFDGRE